MTDTFCYNGRGVKNVISIDKSDASLKFLDKPNGKAVCKISFSSAKIPKDSYISITHTGSLVDNITHIGERNKILGQNSVLRTNANKTDKHQLSDDIIIPNTNPGFLIYMLAGGKLSGPSEWKLEAPDDDMNGWSMNEVYGVREINKIGEYDLKSPQDLAKLVEDYKRSGTTTTFHSWLEQTPIDVSQSISKKSNVVAELSKILPWKKNVILEGVPGVGKTFHIKQLKKHLGIEDNDGRFTAVTFSPSMGVEEFIGGLFPLPGISPPVFSFEEGPLIKLAEAAAQSPSDKKHLLFIDEINRGNIPKIMGEIMTVIEGTKRFPANNSNLVLADNQDGEIFRASMFLNGEKIGYFGLPENLYIVGAMNTSDRSVVQIDSALRRRFAFMRVDTMLIKESSSELKEALLASKQKPKFWSSEKSIQEAEEIFQSLFALNKFLRDNVGPDAMLGHSYLFDLKCCSQQSSGAESNEIEDDVVADTEEIEEPSVDKECFWKAIRDMLLLSVYPQLADTVIANGIGDDHVKTINGYFEKLNSIVNGHLSDIQKLYCQLTKPSSSFGQYRLE
jgi:MoxR-like ATPase